MNEVMRKIDLRGAHDPHELLRREWLVTNALGGYASGTISGHVARRNHGLLTASLPAPLGGFVMFNHLAEFLRLPGGETVQIGGEEPSRPEEAVDVVAE